MGKDWLGVPVMSSVLAVVVACIAVEMRVPNYHAAFSAVAFIVLVTGAFSTVYLALALAIWVIEEIGWELPERTKAAAAILPLAVIVLSAGSFLALVNKDKRDRQFQEVFGEDPKNLGAARIAAAKKIANISLAEKLLAEEFGKELKRGEYQSLYPLYRKAFNALSEERRKLAKMANDRLCKTGEKGLKSWYNIQDNNFYTSAKLFAGSEKSTILLRRGHPDAVPSHEILRFY